MENLKDIVGFEKVILIKKSTRKILHKAKIQNFWKICRKINKIVNGMCI